MSLTTAPIKRTEAGRDPYDKALHDLLVLLASWAATQDTDTAAQPT
jgi:hypothetical protein